MKKISLLVLKSYIGPLFVTFFISVFILLMQFLWKWIEDFVGKGLEWHVIAEIMMYASASLVPMALPLAVLLASVMTFGNMGENYELTALKASGISLQRTMQPLMILIIFLSFGGFFFSNNVLPYTNLKMATRLYDVTHQKPEVNIKQGIFNNDIEGYSIKVGRKSKTSNMMYDFMIYNHTLRQGNPDVTVADSGTLKITSNKKNMIVTLYNGQSYNEISESRAKKEKEYPLRRDKFKKETIIFELVGFDPKNTDEGIFKNHYRMMTLEQLETTMDSLTQIYNTREKKFPKTLTETNYGRYDLKIRNRRDTARIINDSLRRYADYSNLTVIINPDKYFEKLNKTKKEAVLKIADDMAKRTKRSIESSSKDLYERGKFIRKHELEWYRKFSLSFACIIFFFIGAPLGAIIRKGGFGLPFLASTILFMIYYIISITGEKFVREDILPVHIGAWLSSVSLFPLGVFLTYKATTDSALLNTDSYLNTIKKFFANLLKAKNKVQKKRKI